MGSEFKEIKAKFAGLGTTQRVTGSQGFTLLEILLVVTLISILAAVAVTQYADFADYAKTAVTQQKLISLKVAIDGDGRLVSAGVLAKPGYAINCSGLPCALLDLKTQPGQSGNTDTCASAITCEATYNPYTKIGWRGPYVSTTDSDWDLDAWGNAIVYNSSARTLTSMGADGVLGTSDDITVDF